MADTTNSITARQASNGLTGLPVEIQLAIFGELDPVSSLALGLSCPQMYMIHIEVTGIITLDTFVASNNFDAWVGMRGILDLWLGRNWAFNAYIFRYEPAEGTEGVDLMAFFGDDLVGLYYDNDYLSMLLN